MEVAYSVNSVAIRLSYERWYHIVEAHDELASYFHEVLDTIERPDFVTRGNKGALKAVKSKGPKGEVVWRQQ